MNILIKIVMFLFFSGTVCISQTELEIRVKDNISRFFQEKFSAAEDDLKITYKRLPQLNYESSRQIDASVSSQRHKARPGYQTIWVELSRSGRLIKKYPVSLEVVVRKDVWTVKNRIKFHQEITEELLKKESRYIKDNYTNLIFDKNQILGREAKRALRPGTIITSDLLRNAPVVRRGQSIKINVYSGSVLISTEGTAKADGTIGEMINVRCAATGRLLKARVEKPGVVSI